MPAPGRTSLPAIVRAAGLKRTLMEMSGNGPVIVLTARRQEADKVIGLDAGADGGSLWSAQLVVAAWAVLIAIAVPFAPQVPDALRAGGFIRDDLESARAKALLEQQLGTPPSALVVAFPQLALWLPGLERR